MLQHRYLPEENASSQPHRRVLYDTETACRIVERAAELQAADELLTAEDLEALAARSGIEPRYVRRVLAEMGLMSEVRPAPSLPRRKRRLIAGIPLLYGSFLALQMVWLRNVNDAVAPILAVFILPALLSLYLGARLRFARLGALAGILTVACTIAGVFIGLSMFERRQPNVTPQDVAMFLCMLTGGAVFGVVGAEVRHRVPRWLARQRIKRAAKAGEE